MFPRIFVPIVILAVVTGALWFNSKPNSNETVQGTQTQGKYRYHNENEYINVLSQDLWYLDPAFKSKIDNYLEADESKQTKEWIEEKHEFFQVLGDLLEEGKIKTADPKTTPNTFDEEREPIDTIVVHHTQTSPDRNLAWLNGLQMLTLYVPVFSRVGSDDYGTPLWSGHTNEDGTPIFIAYHYLVWPDGHTENPLKDSQIGWHAGLWEVNKSSIGIAFVDDLSNKEPTEKALSTAKNIIKSYQDKNPNIEVLGHKELDPGHTACPGDKFDEWKDELI